MKPLSFLFSALLISTFIWAAPAIAQETPAEGQSPPASEGDIEAGAAAAAAGEEAEREEEENNRRRRMPSETRIDLGEVEAIRVTWTAWPLDGRDFPELSELKSGEVMLITASAPPKLWTHVDLSFGDLTVPEGNVAENYPGVYGLWLRRTDEGWNLIFNDKPDVWGTMYDPSADAGEVPLQYSSTDADGDAFAVELKEGESGSGTLELSWGEHHWSTPFIYGG